MNHVSHSPKEIWDNHSSYQWVYFAEEIKQRISFFLSDKLFGKNLDIGGGWYLTYPNSTVIDISPKALEYNPAKEKIEFDIDSVNDGKKLPFPDHSFDHATMISVYQYLREGKLLKDELMRVLKPGAELYIINLNGGGSGLSEGVVKNYTSIPPIEEEFKAAGFKTFVENIPFRRDIKEVQSLCVAMPAIDLFGPNDGEIRNKEERARVNEMYSRYKPSSGYSSIYSSYEDEQDDPTRKVDHFTDAYSKRELKKMNDLFYKIATYPVTAFSVEYRKSLEAFTQECLAETNCIPIITSYIYNDIRVDMATSKNEIYPAIHIKGGKGKISNEEEDAVMEIAKKHGIRASSSSGRFNGDTPDEIIKNYEEQAQKTEYDSFWNQYRKKGFSETEQDTIICLLAEVPLNSVTKDLQDRLYALVKSRGESEEIDLAKKDIQRMKKRNEDMETWKKEMLARNEKTNKDREDEEPEKPRKPEPYLRPWYCKIDDLISQKKANDYFSMLKAYKQKREVEKLLEIKDQCVNGNIEMTEWKKIDYLSFIPYFPALLDKSDQKAYEGSKGMPEY